MPASFTRAWSNGEIAADMKMTFHPSTREAVTEERYFNPETSAPIAQEDLPWFDKDDRRQKPVPTDMRTGVLDPMAAFVAARSHERTAGRSVISQRRASTRATRRTWPPGACRVRRTRRARRGGSGACSWA